VATSPGRYRDLGAGARLQLVDRIFQHLLVELDADLADMAGLLFAEQVAAAADVEVVAGKLEAGPQAV
jgi:hypothetical protein